MKDDEMRLGFRDLSFLSVFMFLPTAAAQEDKQPVGSKALDYFVGVWNTEVTNKPTKQLPEGGKRTVKEVMARTLKTRFILGRGISQPSGLKSLWLMTYDSKLNSYPHWSFNSRGFSGGETTYKWDEPTKTFLGKAMDTPPGSTAGIEEQFHDRNFGSTHFWFKNRTGELVFEAEAKKARQPDVVSEKIIAAWSKIEMPDRPLPLEMKRLERLVGEWDTAAVAKPAEWTPKEVRTTSRVTRKWVLDGHYLQDTSEVSDGSESLSLSTFQPQMKKFGSWWFNSDGHVSKSIGEWDDATETLSFKSDLDDGLTSRSTVKFIDNDRHIWKVEVKDGDGKLYFDSEWTVTRRKK